MSAVYQHPDGHEINIARSMLTVTNDADESVSVPIGQTGLRELGERLIALSSCEFTAADCAEQAGNTLATAMLNDMLRADSQAEISKALTRALHDLFRLPYEARAAAGFAVGLVNVLEIGLQHLPKGASI